MAKTYDKKPALGALIIGKPKGDDDEMEDMPEDDEKGGDDLKKEACARLAMVLGLPEEKHAELADALRDVFAAYDEDEPEEEPEGEEPEET